MINLRSEPDACRPTPNAPSAARGTLRAVCIRFGYLLLMSAGLARDGNATGALVLHPNADNAWLVRHQQTCDGEVAGQSPLQVALRHYVKAADPVPRRFLTAVGSDSAISEMGSKVLSEYGPTYYYAGSDAVKAALKDKLERIGPSPALLVVLRRNKPLNATTQTVRLGGHYISGEFDGKLATSRMYTLRCAAAGWAITESREEPAK